MECRTCQNEVCTCNEFPQDGITTSCLLIEKILSLITILFFILCIPVSVHAAEPIAPELAARAIIGEAADQGYQGMLAVAVAIRNRGTLKGVYGVKAKHVDSEPQWVWQLARKAWSESEYNRIHNGDHWGSLKCDKEWIAEMEESGYVKEYQYNDHAFYSAA